MFLSPLLCILSIFFCSSYVPSFFGTVFNISVLKFLITFYFTPCNSRHFLPDCCSNSSIYSDNVLFFFNRQFIFGYKSITFSSFFHSFFQVYQTTWQNIQWLCCLICAILVCLGKKTIPWTSSQYSSESSLKSFDNLLTLLQFLLIMI